VKPIGALADEKKSESAPIFFGIKDVSRKGAKRAKFGEEGILICTLAR
jgi:hypothetical protein